jgi:membrane protease YdiL (CAAX protease family)
MKQIQKILKFKLKWPWQIALMLIPLILLYPGFGVDRTIKIRLVIGWVIYAVFEFLVNVRRFPRDRTYDRKVIPVFLLVGAEFIVDGIYAYVNHLPFFRYPVSAVLQNAFLNGWREEIYSTLILVTALLSLFYHWKKTITKRHLTLISFAAGFIFGVFGHIENLPGLWEVNKDKPQYFIIMVCSLHIVNAIAGGLIFKSIFLKTGSLFYCIILHFLVDVSRMGTVFPRESLIYGAILMFIYLIYGAYESIRMDEMVANEWNKRLKRANSDSMEIGIEELN